MCLWRMGVGGYILKRSCLTFLFSTRACRKVSGQRLLCWNCCGNFKVSGENRWRIHKPWVFQEHLRVKYSRISAFCETADVGGRARSKKRLYFFWRRPVRNAIKRKCGFSTNSRLSRLQISYACADTVYV